MQNPDLEYLVEIIRKDFSIYPVKKILEILDVCVRNIKEEEKITVCLALIKLSCMDIEKLRFYVNEAKKDYKQILFWDR